MEKHVLRIIGLLPLLFAMTLLGSGVSYAGPGTAALTKAETWFKDDGWGGRDIVCELWIDNPSEDRIVVEITWNETPYQYGALGYSDAVIHETLSNAGWDPAAGNQSSSITIRGLNNTTNNTDFAATVPVPGSWS